MKPVRALIALTSLSGVLVLAGCGSSGHKGGGYYQDDGPGSDIPANVLNTPDAVPRIEAYASANLRPYRVLGKSYVPMTSSAPFSQTGVASWYGKKFHGRKTANGETYNMYAMTAAHPTLPIPSYARVTRPDTGATVVVRINDRGPFHNARVIDLSYAAAARLGLINRGKGTVRVEAITHSDIARAQSSQPAQKNTVAHVPAAVQPIAVTASPVTTSPATTSPVTATPNALAVLDEASLTQLQPAPQNSSASSDTTQTGTNPDIFLQFGAFSGQSNAESLARQLNHQITQTEPHRAQVQSYDGLHRVQIGPFASRTEAVNAAMRILQYTGAQATVAIRD